MKTYSRKSGFSLIELLTVIGIIAILAAIIFPVMSSVRSRANVTNCMTNLQQISTALSMFKMDNHRYPTALVPVVAGASFDGAKSDGGLFGEYVKGGAAVFSCRSSSFSDKSPAAIAAQDVGPTAQAAATAGTPNYVYTYSSYDGYVYNNKFEQHYCYDWWTGARPTVPGTDMENYARQLKFRNPPDTTVVTWCSFHEVRAGSDPSQYRGKANVLFLSGRCTQILASKVELERWTVRPE